MPLELPDLPYPYDALEPIVSAATLKVHHGKHHRGYVNKVNTLVDGTTLAGASLEAIVRLSAQRAKLEPSMVGVFNNAAQAWNHTFYWNSLRPVAASAGVHDALAARIRADFVDHSRLVEDLKLAASSHFGSGWAWLVLDGEMLRVVTTSNADTPLVHGQVPLLCVDVWEHAYYLDYREQRAAHVAAVVDKLLNWEFASANLSHAGKRSGAGAAAPGQAV